ncbi:succinate dehydrogenase / fumarate reductase iron-sulfur subunit [Caldalkalibacillus uzonensis]|uniref:Fumarate reductase iron-sulfur subunit n=1 Tax=Caldalkalibacillus uzonensis TaxID=353224 RepID=A0ABU0CRQ6_9BACI|nr:succinate dehydrogenase/fumarate reductase iron-sulfur subunit [Caldalkalibacillus uzonensis]MDQ0339044.1 succinate dehydrogenase / fumarate reductase iron-sulfur subunit [Caldalkalibacillus uzonensis]
MENITFRIRRYDGTNTWVQEYRLPYEKGKTILWALTKIKDEIDPTLNFTSACRHAICGSCGVKVNGHAFLACKTSLDKLLETFDTSVLYFEPLGNYDVVRDLVVDWKPKMEKMKKVKPWLLPSREGSKEEGFRQSKQQFAKISSSTDCILCGICASECGQLAINDGGYLEPFIINKAYRFVVDSRDNAPEEHIRPVLENELWKCIHCMQCVSKCPKEIPLTDEIAYLRKETMKMGEVHNQGARHAYAFYHDVKKWGRLNEMTLPVKTDGMVTTLRKRIPFAYRMIVKGKINPLRLPKAVKGIKGVRKIYQQVEEESKS